ncbi:hypothetical protein [Cellulomonas sp. C5510]|uniref:hypothetical protein n=1 Tax=Cellulomonas sp. C5510 TaxID=2871170 RepID=UPI001C957F18|nr:hypothetical protein [Cellulomonas sp. C5510]QZN86604.1 hypothetical protein K5O09_05505 [Cellulomonas sp. C5510]
MTQTSWPFENADTSETQYSYLVREFLDPGVAGAPGDTTLRVTAGSTGLAVTVAPGRAFARGYMLSVTGTESLALEPAHASLARIDRVVARFDPTADAATLEVVPGTPGSGAAPALTVTDTGVFDLALASVAVAAGQTTTSASDVTDERVYLGNVWSTATRPGSTRNPVPPVKGRSLGFNLTLNAYEYWDGAAWRPLIPPPPTWATLTGKPTTSTLDGRTITVSDDAPTAGTGAPGDIWLEY